MGLNQRADSQCAALRWQRPVLQRAFAMTALAVVLGWAYDPSLLSAAESGKIEPLKVHEEGRFLVTASGKPFFWLGDTCWHMYGKSVHDDRDDQPSVEKYFANRAEKGFTVIQSVFVREPIGGSVKNAYGFDPFIEDDWSRPQIGPGENDDYWDHVDWCIRAAKRHGLRMAALPMWLQSIPSGHAMETRPEAAYRYGHFLGKRYGREPHLIWVLGGDAYQKGRNVDNPSRLALVRALAEGIADGASGKDQFDGNADWNAVLMTFHPPGGNRSSGNWLHDEPWLDFHMIQTTTRFRFQNWKTVKTDYARRPPKPTLDAEVAYEDSLSLNKEEPQDRRIRPWDVRRAAYWSVFAGGFGFTYGHRSFIGWIRKGETYRYGAHIPWYDSLDAPGAFQVVHLRRLIESRPFLTRVPKQSLLADDLGDGDDHLQATADRQGRFAMVYSPMGRAFTVKAGSLAGPARRAWWFDPRTGEAKAIEGDFSGGELKFTPPTEGEEQDWVLVLDAAAENYPPPGAVPVGRRSGE